MDVARVAGVSQSAVSLVFGGKSSGRVSPQTERGILRAAGQLGYTPNLTARSLRSGKSRLFLAVVPDSANPYFAGALKGAEREARKHGYAVALATVRTADDWHPVVLSPLHSRAVEGFILFASYPAEDGQRRSLRHKAVLVDGSCSEFRSIELDIAAGVAAALDYLHESNHNRIGHLGCSFPRETFLRRRQTYRSWLSKTGLKETNGYEELVSFDVESATLGAQKILQRHNRPSALLCDSDILAVGAYKAARSLGLKIPHDLSIVSVDDSIVARILDPELTSIAVPAELLGEHAVQALVDVLSNSPAMNQNAIPLKLIVRGSTACYQQAQKDGPVPVTLCR